MKIHAYKNGSGEKVLKLEKNFRVKLPEDYRNFLIHNNGGDVEDGHLYVKDLDEYMLMGYFSGIGVEAKSADIIKFNDEFYDDIPKKSILIGSDAGEGWILLVCGGENNGVWYYDHTYFFDQSTDDLNTYFICETFSDFLKMLETTSPTDDV